MRLPAANNPFFPSAEKATLMDTLHVLIRVFDTLITMRILYLLLVSLALVLSSCADKSSFTISFMDTSPQQTYAAKKVITSLQENGYWRNDVEPDYRIIFQIDTVLGAEAYRLNNERSMITITGGDNRGLIYGGLSLVEQIRNGRSLDEVESMEEEPHYLLRAIKFDLPWDTYRHSYALDQHMETCKDPAYWEAFLDMMAENRFNALTLWNLHPYPFMIKPTNYPEATPFSDEELKTWQDLHHAIFDMAEERAIDTYLIPFNIFVSPEFARAHNVAMNNLDHAHYVTGDTSSIIKKYTRESVTQVLKEYPNLTGFGLTLGEAMGGMTPREREEWMMETIIAGMAEAGRKTKLVHRIPFSSTTESLGITSIDTEKMTREYIEKQADMDFIEGPIFADLKYNWSHAHSTPTLVKVHGGKLYDTYFSPVPESYRITWTARNEDFFCLRWGVPAFVRAHIAENSQPYAGGYFIGSETYIPALDYFTAVERPANSWKYAFERQWLFYKIWGRLLYNPVTPDAVFHNEFIRRYGDKADKMLEAYSLASSTPLRFASSYDFTWDFTLYSEGFLALDNRIDRVDYVSVDRQINRVPLDPSYVSIRDFVKATLADSAFADDRITPPELADMLEHDCQRALELVKNVDTGDDLAFMYEVADVRVWANLGLYFAEKLRGAVALHTYRISGGEDNKQAAVAHLEQSLAYWDEVVAITRPIYKDMPLVHFSEQDGKHWSENNDLRFHWEIIRPEVAKDVEIAREAEISN